ncbi:Uncharacterised protein [Mycobacteroides abscessus subsp. abscessus]|nr:Uncharacterised protein [Mycobacteroides abscessus subsp. abscessus]
MLCRVVIALKASPMLGEINAWSRDQSTVVWPGMLTMATPFV